MIDTDGVLAIVQAGGSGSRMDVLTRERAKPALPFGGSHRLIDFALSSLAHSRVQDVWVAVQYQASTLDTYLAGGRPWDLDRTRGGYRRFVPQSGAGTPVEDGFSHGNADLLLRMRGALAQHHAHTVAVLSADSIFALDLRPALAAHLEADAVATLVTTEVTKAEASHQVLLHTDGDRVTAVESKPARPTTTTAATEVFLYNREVLLDTLDELRRALAHASEGSDSGLGDFAEHLLPALIDRGTVLAWPMTGYWRDVGRPESYLRAHRELLAGRVDAVGHPGLPLLSNPPALPAARFGASAAVSSSIVSAGCVVDGEVRGSVLGHGVVVEEGAVVEDSVVLDDVRIGRGARLGTAIVDADVTVGERAVVGEAVGRRLPSDDEIVLVGAQSRIGAGATLAPGSRLEPGTSA